VIDALHIEQNEGLRGKGVWGMVRFAL
jgi:hypothetical protein